MSPATLTHDLSYPPAPLSTADQVACDVAADAVLRYLVRLGLPKGNPAVEQAAIDVSHAASRRLPPLKRGDTSAVREAAIRLVVRDLDHWLRQLAIETPLTTPPVPAASRVAAFIETGTLRVVPGEVCGQMAPQRFRSRLATAVRTLARPLRRVVRRPAAQK